MHTYSCYDVFGKYLGSVSANNKGAAWMEARKLYGTIVVEIIKDGWSF